MLEQRVKLGNVQALRAIAVLLVLGVHIAAPDGFERKYLGVSHWIWWMFVPGRVGVDLFFVISGLIMTVTTWRLDHDTAAAGQFLWRRVTRIYPAYWIPTTLVFALFLVRPSWVNANQGYPPQPLASFLLLPQPGPPLLLVGWTLTYEMYFYLIFAVALAVGRRWLPPILGIWGVATILLALTPHHDQNPWAMVAANPIILEFLFGVIVGQLVMRNRFGSPKIILTVGIVAALALLAIAAKPGETDFPNLWYRVLGVGGALTLIVYGAVGLEIRHKVTTPAVTQQLGDASYSIYLWHVLILAALGRAIARLLPTPGGILHPVLLIAAPLTTIAISVILYRLIEKPLLTVFHHRRPQQQRRRDVTESDHCVPDAEGESARLREDDVTDDPPQDREPDSHRALPPSSASCCRWST